VTDDTGQDSCRSRRCGIGLRVVQSDDIKISLFMIICDGSSGILHCSVDTRCVTQLLLYVDLTAVKVIWPVILLFINLRSFIGDM